MNKIESLKEEEFKYIVIQVLGFFLKKKKLPSQMLEDLVTT